MERKYYRQYDAYDKVVPHPNDFPPVYRAGVQEIAHVQPSSGKEEACKGGREVLPGLCLKTDDILLLMMVVLLLMEEEKDYLTIGLLAAVFLSEYIL